MKVVPLTTFIKKNVEKQRRMGGGRVFLKLPTREDQNILTRRKARIEDLGIVAEEAEW